MTTPESRRLFRSARIGGALIFTTTLGFVACDEAPSPTDIGIDGGVGQDQGEDLGGDGGLLDTGLDAGDAGDVADGNLDVGDPDAADVGPDLAPDASSDADAADVTEDLVPDRVEEPDIFDEPDAELYDLSFVAEMPATVHLVTNATIPAGTVVFPEAQGGLEPYRYTASPLPAGVLFSETSRALRGTPTVAGNTNLTYTATDARGATGEVTVQIVVGEDTFGPEPPTGLRFVDGEGGATTLRPPDFGFEWTQSVSPDTARQLIYVYPAGGSADGGVPIADLAGTAGDFTFTELLDSHGDCLEEDTPYEAEWVLFDTAGNRSPAETATVGERAAFRLSFTSEGPDISNRTGNPTFDFSAARWEGRATGEGSPSIALSWDSTRDASSCPDSGSMLVTNDSDAGAEVTGGTVAIAHQCVEVTGTRTYGFSVDAWVPPDQPREGLVLMSAVWYPEPDCEGIAEGNATTPSVDSTDGWELLYFDGVRIPRVAVSAELQLVVVKHSPDPGQDDDAPFQAWFDNIAFGRNE